MSAVNLENIAKALVGDGKGILAADETPETLTKRFDALKIQSTPASRCAYREMLISTPNIGEFIGGVIMQDETIHQKASTGKALATMAAEQGMVPGIKVDIGAKSLAGRPGETITEGLDGLRDRLKNYRQIGARFAKWRAVIHISDGIPTAACINANAAALARYAALCQEQGLVPIVEPEVLMDGGHSIQRCEEVTANVIDTTTRALFEQGVIFEAMLLKPNMVVPGKQAARQVSDSEVAEATMRCLRRHAPAAIPAIVFLSGGLDAVTATTYLNAMNKLDRSTPWKLSFSFGRALQDEALKAWRGKPENVQAGQRALFHRAKCVSAAALARYDAGMEVELAA